MYTTTSGIKRSFYAQTGQFQFGVDIMLDNTTGLLNFGLSGSGVSNLNFLLSGGKIIEPGGKFLSSYSAGNQVSISGNCDTQNYDILINKYPFLYNNLLSTGGFYNYIYLNPKNTTLSYNFYINGETPNLTVSSITGYSGDLLELGYIVNNNPGIPLRIFSGVLVGFNSGANSPFYFSGVSTGDIVNTGYYYIFPNGGLSLGGYTGTLQLTTNGGSFFYPVGINISGSTAFESNSVIINGPQLIFHNNTQQYTANIFSSVGLPFYISLNSVSGTGNFFTNIEVVSGYNKIISGFIVNSGTIYQSITGKGTGIGGQANNTGSGFCSGQVGGTLQYATGIFTWVTPVTVSGYGTGAHYSGIGTGTYNYPSTGKIVNGSGTYSFNNSIKGNIKNLQSVGPTGYIHGTGGIFYNTPQPFDKLYVNNSTFAIVNGFSYVGITGLTGYLNTNTGIHLVTSIISGGFVILSGVLGAKSDGVLFTDVSNAGNMFVIGSQIIGGKDLGVGQNLTSIGNISGYVNMVLTGSGIYSQKVSGYISGSGNIIDYTKTFTGSWNLSTGSSPAVQTSYLVRNFTSNNFSRYSNNFPVTYINSTNFIKVAYSNNNDIIPDVSILVISGKNTNFTQSILITGYS